MISNCEKEDFSRPKFRKLRAYAFDPSLSLQLDTNIVNNIVYKVAWDDGLKPGPVGEYIEVVDYDPSSGHFYKPVDLNAPFILAQDGLDPSESNPQFHQQMVYTVAMTTIRNFELALGRKIMWSEYLNAQRKSTYVQRLRIYPHALREANAYYSPQKKALLFGYFSSTPDSPGLQMPGCTVYTCLSHDIIAHEITHALLDGMHRRYVEATHQDSLAFHEAFADIVALFQHFTFPEVLKDQIAKTGGDLRAQNLLGELAQQFGKAIGHYGSLRDAIGKFDPEKKIWQPHVPDPHEYQKVKEPHARGAILVATIFDAFISLYKRRIADLVRIATGGTGILPPGSLHPDLVNRMANEASKTAGHILKICIRALDYCPPLDINFGDYLRALITSDYDLVSDDNLEYRIAIIEAFQKRGIFPENVKNMSVESLLCKVEDKKDQFESRFAKLIDFFRQFKEKISYITNRKEIYELTKIFIGGGKLSQLSSNRGKKYLENEDIIGLHERLNMKFLSKEDAVDFGELTGLILDDYKIDERGIARSKGANTFGMPMLEVHNLKLASRSGPKGETVNQIIVTLTQKRGVVGQRDKWGNPEIIGFFKPDAPKEGWYRRIPVEGKPNDPTYVKEEYKPRESGSMEEGSDKVLPDGWFIFRGGSTLIFDLDYSSDDDEVKLQYVIPKGIDDEKRMREQFNMLFNQQNFSLNATYFGAPMGNLEAEPFAIIHKVL